MNIYETKEKKDCAFDPFSLLNNSLFLNEVKLYFY
jgi:hypothetical protein